MNRTAFLLLGTLLLSSAAHADEWVEGHVDDGGAWVEGHLKQGTDNGTTPSGHHYGHYHVDPVQASASRADLGAAAGANSAHRKYRSGGRQQADTPEYLGPPNYYLQHRKDEEEARKRELQILEPDSLKQDAPKPDKKPY
ncbi:MAG: hypothetical protein ACRETW_10545 [Stenotrophobium sp.]